MPFNRTRVKTSDRVLEDVVRRSAVELEADRRRRKWIALVSLLFGIAAAWIYSRMAGVSASAELNSLPLSRSYQKSICALIFANRGVSTVVGRGNGSAVL
jgi:hypothetical protein